ncbi:MAG: alkaline phosphatase family protein [Sulfolobus sp.]|nr:alkaline phosphatase family protein [Sulfolobus sp.]
MFSSFYKEKAKEKSITIIEGNILDVKKNKGEMKVITDKEEISGDLIVFSSVKQPKIEIMSNIGLGYKFNKALHIYQPQNTNEVNVVGGSYGFSNDFLSLMSSSGYLDLTLCKEFDPGVCDNDMEQERSPYLYSEDGMVCECEDLDMKDISFSTYLVNNVEGIKRVTGLGTGHCQGKVCSFLAGSCGKEEVRGVTFLHSRDNNIYMSPISFLNYRWGNSLELQEKVWKDVVYKHGMILDGDYHSLNRGLIDFNEYLKTVDLAYSFFLNYTMYMLENTNWDVALTYLPIVDNLQHLLYGLSDKKAFSYIVKGYELADEFIKTQLDYADLVIVCSDHGISKIKKRIFINKFLEKINVLKLKDNDEIDWNKTKAYYGGGGQIRINLKAREKFGIVSSKEFPKLVRYIVRNLENLIDEENNERIFTSIIEKETPANDREGDITIMGIKDDYGISSVAKKELDIIEKVKEYKMTSGEHGYFRKDDLYGIIIAYDKNVKTRKSIINAKIIDIAPTVLKLFNITNVKMDGKPIITLVERYGNFNNN